MFVTHEFVTLIMIDLYQKLQVAHTESIFPSPTQHRHIRHPGHSPVLSLTGQLLWLHAEFVYIIILMSSHLG